MNELEALARELRRQLPPVPEELMPSQLRRLLRDPRVRGSRLRRRWFVLAMSAAIIGTLLVLPWPLLLHAPDSQRLLDAERSALEHVLADGTRLHLDVGARGVSSDGATDGVRFRLEHGRVTFDVVPQKGRVFRVVAGEHSVSVLGTRFSVAFEAGGAFSVSVELGSVLVTPAGGSPIRLMAGGHFDEGGPRPEVSSGAESVKPAGAAAQMALAPASPTPVAPPLQQSSKPSSPAHEPRWRQLHREREYSAALAAARADGLGRFMNELGPVPLTELADVARLGGDLPVALQVLAAIERRFPATEQARQAQFLSGRILVQLGRSAEAATVFESYLGANPEGTLSTEALGRLLEIHAKDGDTERAKRIAERYLKRAPNGPYRRLARSLIVDR